MWLMVRRTFGCNLWVSIAHFSGTRSGLGGERCLEEMLVFMGGVFGYVRVHDQAS